MENMKLIEAFYGMLKENEKIEDLERRKEITFSQIGSFQKLFEDRLYSLKVIKLCEEEMELLIAMYKWMRDADLALTRTCAGTVALISLSTGMSFEDIERL